MSTSLICDDDELRILELWTLYDYCHESVRRMVCHDLLPGEAHRELNFLENLLKIANEDLSEISDHIKTLTDSSKDVPANPVDSLSTL